MDFRFSEEQVLLRDTLKRFVHDHYTFEHRRRIIDSPEGYSREHWRRFAELGWLGIPFSEDDGGLGGSMVDVMIVMEEFGRGLVVEPYLANIVLAGGILRSVASESQRRALLPPLIEGSLMMSLAYAEPIGRYLLREVRTTAERNSDGFAINGHKAVALNGAGADKFIVSARTSGTTAQAEGITLFVVDGEAAGLSRRGYSTVDGFRAADIRLNNVQVAESAVLGALGEGLAPLRAAIDDAIVAVGAEGAGVMDFLIKATVEHTKTRKQFGVPIASFQVLQHRMVDMFIECEQTISLLYRAAMMSARGGLEAQRAASVLKIQLGKAARNVGQQAVQLQGAMGMADEVATSHYFKRLSMIGQQFGNADFHADRYTALDA